MERAPDEARPFHVLAGGLHPDDDPIAHCRTTCLPALNDLLVPILLDAQALGVLPWGTIRLDGTQIHADASKGRAISAKRLRERDSPLRLAVDTLGALTEQTEQTAIPEGVVSADALAFRHERLVTLAQAKAV
jgi:hypothetical protein